MARSKNQKKEMVANYVEKIKASKAMYLVEPNKITANQSVSVKKDLYDLDSSYNVVKNNLFKIALTECGLEPAEDLTANPKAVIFSSDNVSESAKVIKKFMSENEEGMIIKHGYLDGKMISASQIKDLAELPSKDVMIAQVIGTMNAPITGFVNVLAGNVRSIVNVINAIKDQKGS